MKENENKPNAVNEPIAEIYNNSNETISSKKSLKNEILGWLRTIVVAVVLTLVIQNFIFTGVRVDGPSMEPTLQNNDRLIVWRLGYKPHQGDIVVFQPPYENDENTYWIKRIVATEGQHVEIDYTTSSVFVDGEKIDEPYLGEQMVDRGGYTPITEIDVPENCVFVLGDNRNNSADGRVIGAVSEDSLVGKAIFRLWPFTEIEIF